MERGTSRGLFYFRKLLNYCYSKLCDLSEQTELKVHGKPKVINLASYCAKPYQEPAQTQHTKHWRNRMGLANASWLLIFSDHCCFSRVNICPVWEIYLQKLNVKTFVSLIKTQYGSGMTTGVDQQRGPKNSQPLCFWCSLDRDLDIFTFISMIYKKSTKSNNLFYTLCYQILDCLYRLYYTVNIFQSW